MRAACLGFFVVIVLLVASHTAQVFSNAQPTLPASSDRDGQRDFDFLVGSWKLHLKRLTKPLTRSADWEELDGALNCRKVCGGKANIEEVVLDGKVSHATFRD